MNGIARQRSGTDDVEVFCRMAVRLWIILIIGFAGVIPLVAVAQLPEHLKYLGRYESQGLLDEFQDVAVVGDDGRYLATASVIGLAIVEREAVKAGTVERPLQRYRIKRKTEPSNLDGAPLQAKWAPKFYEIASFGSFLYVATRFDGLWIFGLESSGAVNELGRLLRPREFTESVKILGDTMYLTHHVDGIELLDLADPGQPATLGTLADGFVDAWGIAPEVDGSIWVADGAGGVKLAHWDGNQLTHITGETIGTSPGMVQDVAVVGDWVVGAVSGQGVAVYDKATASRTGAFALPGVCVDLEPINDRRVAVSCTSWVHVIELDTAGVPAVIASTRLHRREPDATRYVPSHNAYRLAWDGEVLYVGGWHHADAYQLVADDPDDDPDIQLSGQRAHFSTAPGVSPEVIKVQVANGGEGALSISDVICPTGIECSLGATTLAPDETTDLTLSYDGTTPDLQTQVDILSNDPDDDLLRINVFTPGTDNVDPQEPAPDFSGSFVTYDYDTKAFVESEVSLSDFANAGQAVHFGFFGAFCPACAWKGASVAADITAHLPEGAMNFLVEVPSSRAPVQHMMEKIRMPVGFMFSSDGSKLYKQPDNANTQGLPAFRDYVIDPAGTVTTVLANEYSPNKILAALEDAVGNGGPPPGEADLSISKADTPDPVQVGEPLTYTLQVQNNGPDSANGVVLTDALPAGTSLVSASSNQGTCAQVAGVVSCNPGSLAAGGTVTVTIVVTPVVNGLINNTASVTAGETDPIPENNTATVDTTVEGSLPAGNADLAVSKSDTPDPAQVGQPLTYSLQVQNNGPDSANGVVLTDTLPAGITFISASTGQGTCTQSAGVVSCNLGSVTSGGTVTVTIIVMPVTNGLINNTASVTADETDPIPENNAATIGTTVEGSLPEELEVVAVSPGVLAAGDVAQLTVSGTGFDPAATVKLCRTGGVAIDAVTVVDSHTILVDVTVAADRPPGVCGLRVINPDGERDTLVPAFSTE